MTHKNKKILKNTLTPNEIELARKYCRALNILLDIRKNKITCKSTLFKSIDFEFNQLCKINKENANLLNSVIIFDKNSFKFKLNWK